MTLPDHQCIQEAAEALQLASDDAVLVREKLREEVERVAEKLGAPRTNKAFKSAHAPWLVRMKVLLARLDQYVAALPGVNTPDGAQRRIGQSGETSRRADTARRPPFAIGQFHGWLQPVYGLPGAARYRFLDDGLVSVVGTAGSFDLAGGELRVPDPEGRLVGAQIELAFDPATGALGIRVEGKLPVWMDRLRVDPGEPHVAASGTHLFLPTVQKTVFRFESQRETDEVVYTP